MAVSITEFFRKSDTGVSDAIYTNVAGTKKTIQVRFHDNWKDAQIQLANTDIAALCKTDDVTGATIACTLKINDVTYYVKAVHSYDNGISVVELSKDQV